MDNKLIGQQLRDKIVLQKKKDAYMKENAMENADLVAIRKLLEADKARKDQNQKAIGYVCLGIFLFWIGYILKKVAIIAG